MYFVAYEHNELAGYYRGVRFWTSFPSKEAFEQSQQVPSHTVIAHGDNQDEIQEIALDYDPELLSQVAAGEILEKLNQCLHSVNNKKQFAKELKIVAEYAEMKTLHAKFAVAALKGTL